MFDAGRADNRLTELEKEIGELIIQIKNSRNEAPGLKMKEVRRALQDVKRRLRDFPGTLDRAELVLTLQFTVEALNKAMDNSRSKKLAKAHKQALDLLIKFY
jgi:hypothetical protein